MIEITNYPQLDFQINNKDETNTVYITDDPSKNDLTFVISTNVNETTFAPGQLVPKTEAGSAKGSLLYLDLTNLELGTEEYSNLVFRADGWQFKVFTDENLICMTPTSNITLSAGENISVKIEKLVLSSSLSPGDVQLKVTYYRVENITQGNLSILSNFKVILQYPPEAKENLHQDLHIDVDQKYVVSNNKDGYDPVSNKLSIIFNLNNQTEIKADENTAFTVTFVYADDKPGYGALTTVSNALNFNFQAGTNAEKWTITSRKQQENPSWLLEPPNGTILSPGLRSTVEINIDNILTDFQPGPTLMIIYYTGVPGYQDGAYFVLLEKVPHVCIKTLNISPNPALLVNCKATINISWKVYDAGTLILKTPSGEQDVTNKTECTVDIIETSTITLEAHGLQLANVGNIAIKNEIATVPGPVKIESFTIKPTVTDPGQNAILRWKAINAIEASIDNGIGSVDIPEGSITVNPLRDISYTLTCNGSNGPVQSTVNLPVNCVKITRFDAFSGDMTFYTVKWSTQRATSVKLIRLSSGKILSTDPNGSFDYFASDCDPNTAIELICEGPGGPTSKVLYFPFIG